jgi:hypothetical protein
MQLAGARRGDGQYSTGCAVVDVRQERDQRAKVEVGFVCLFFADWEPSAEFRTEREQVYFDWRAAVRIERASP